MDIQSSAGSSSNNNEGMNSASRFRRPLYFLLAGLFLFFILRNLFFRDYSAETKDYLIGSGASQATIDQFLPPSSVELQKQKYSQLQLFDQLLANMTTVIEEQQQLRQEMKEIKQALAASPSFSSPPITASPPITETSAPPLMKRRNRRRLREASIVTAHA